MSPRDDRDITAALSRPRNGNGTQRLSTDAPDAAPPSIAEDSRASLLIHDAHHAGRWAGLRGMPPSRFFGLTGDLSSTWEVELMLRGWSWRTASTDRWQGQHGTPQEAAAAMLRARPELWPESEAAEDAEPLREAARDAARLLRRAGHAATRAEEPAGEPYCCICDEDWPCEVEQARRTLAAALEDR